VLHDFIRSHHDGIVRRTRIRVDARMAPQATNEGIENGILRFLGELVETLRERLHSNAAIDERASRHGGTRFESGFSVSQLVHDYGDVCQVVTGLAIESGAPVTTEEYRTLNGCLDDAIAAAVTEHARAAESATADRNTERLGVLAHELRNQLNSALLAYDILRGGTVSIGGSTGSVLGRSLLALRSLVERSLVEVRLDVGLHEVHPIDVAGFLARLEPAEVIAANSAQVALPTDFGADGVSIQGDEQLLGSAVTNLLQNAFKFTPPGKQVSLRASATPELVAIEVEDQCGGISDHVMSGLFKAFHQGSHDRTGLGLGLVISMRAVESMHGHISVRNKSPVGCVFSIELPRIASPVLAV